MAKEKKINIKEVIIVTITLTLICLITTALLAIVNSVTEKPIEQNFIEAQNKARKSVIVSAIDPNATTEEQIEAIVINFVEIEKDKSYKAFDENGNLVGYAVSTSASGYGGDIVVMTGFDAEGKIIKVEIVSADDETPGLGQNITKDSFLDKFKGKSGELKLVTASQKTGADNEIDAVTSATISSTAAVKAVNEASKIVSDVIAGNAQGGDGQ